jgi:hypothetical protein
METYMETYYRYGWVFFDIVVEDLCIHSCVYDNMVLASISYALTSDGKTMQLSEVE